MMESSDLNQGGTNASLCSGIVFKNIDTSVG